MEQQATIKAEAPEELAPDQLRWTCPTELFPFTTTAEIAACNEVIGQARALRALQLGLEVKSSGYNIFVTGLVGTGRTSTIKQILEILRGDERVPDDHLFVYNFKDPDQPRHLRLPAGQGRRLKKQMEGLISTLKERLPQIFESDAYQQRKKEIVEEIRQQEKDIIKQFEQKVNEKNFALIQVQMGPVTRPGVFPIVQGNPMPLTQVEAMVDKGEFPRERFESMQKEHDALTDELQNIHKKLRALEQQLQSAAEELESRTAKPYAAGLIQEIKEAFRNERLHDYLDRVLENIVKGLDRFGESSAGQAPQMVPMQGMMLPQPRDPFIDFQVNLVVDNAEARRPPVVVENHPSYRNLFGTIERLFEHAGGWSTDFTHIKAGALLRANGGYLVINALDALLELGVWPAMKRTLRTRLLEIQNLDAFSVLGASAMKPEPIPIDLKVVMIGDERLYHLLTNFEEDFSKIFKVKADFDSVTDRDEETLHKYACFVKKIGEEEHLLPFDRSGVATVVEAAVRHAGRQSKISTQFSKVADVVREGSYWAARDNQTVVSRPYVEQAIRERILRVNLIEEKIQELIEEGTLFIDTDGVALGQVNGLAVLGLGDYAFGKPSRITATVSMGRAGIINIEREAEMSGKTHNKGVYILSGYLRGKYAQDKPLTMSASLCFEQSYAEVEGDSASSTEVYALLSSLAGMPLRQDIAVTGSVNQRGQIQPIGGVNEKIEGFFDVCRARGLTGRQGVIIPAVNTKDLMLRQEVVDAVRAGRFHVYPVRSIDEGIEILTGTKAGERGPDGTYAEGTVNRVVDDRLAELARRIASFDQQGRDGAGPNEETKRDERRG